MERSEINDIVAKIRRMTIWLNWLVGFMLCAILLMMIGGVNFAKTYTSGPMDDAAREINDMGVSASSLGLAIFGILTIIFIIIAIVRLKNIKELPAVVKYKKLSRIWMMIPILLAILPVWILILSSIH